MEVKVKQLTLNEVEKASKLLEHNFVDDKGIIALFKRNDKKYKSKVYLWFLATLKMLINNKQFINGAYINDELIGISIVTNSAFKPRVWSILTWTVSVLTSCGYSTVMKSAKHDQQRKPSFTQQNQYILEFIAVNPNYRGKGIGRKLFTNLHSLAKKTNSSVWLETTKENNINIFQKMGYKLVDEKNEDSTKYYIMTNV